LLRGFFRRQRPWFADLADGGPSNYEPAAFPTLNPLLWRPVAAGLWRQRELFDGTYDVGDLLDALEFLDVKDENERRFREANKHEN
jgi:hypothetical protein